MEKRARDGAFTAGRDPSMVRGLSTRIAAVVATRSRSSAGRPPCDALRRPRPSCRDCGGAGGDRRRAPLPVRACSASPPPRLRGGRRPDLRTSRRKKTWGKKKKTRAAPVVVRVPRRQDPLQEGLRLDTRGAPRRVHRLATIVVEPVLVPAVPARRPSRGDTRWRRELARRRRRRGVDDEGDRRALRRGNGFFAAFKERAPAAAARARRGRRAAKPPPCRSNSAPPGLSRRAPSLAPFRAAAGRRAQARR